MDIPTIQFIVFLHSPESSSGRSCKYGGEEEYWIEVRETGKVGQEKRKQKEEKEITQDVSSPGNVFDIISKS